MLRVFRAVRSDAATGALAAFRRGNTPPAMTAALCSLPPPPPGDQSARLHHLASLLSSLHNVSDVDPTHGNSLLRSHGCCGHRTQASASWSQVPITTTGQTTSVGLSGDDAEPGRCCRRRFDCDCGRYGQRGPSGGLRPSVQLRVPRSFGGREPHATRASSAHEAGPLRAPPRRLRFLRAGLGLQVRPCRSVARDGPSKHPHQLRLPLAGRRGVFSLRPWIPLTRVAAERQGSRRLYSQRVLLANPRQCGASPAALALRPLLLQPHMPPRRPVPVCARGVCGPSSHQASARARGEKCGRRCVRRGRLRWVLVGRVRAGDTAVVVPSRRRLARRHR